MLPTLASHSQGEFLIQIFHVWKVGWRQMVNLADLKIFLLETKQKETFCRISAAPASRELKERRDVKP